MFAESSFDEACTKATEAARYEGDLLALAIYSEGGSKWLSIVPLAGLTADKSVEYRSMEDEWVQVFARHHYCLTNWPSSKGVRGNNAYYLSERFNSNGEVVLEARHRDDASTTQTWHISFCQGEITVNSMKAVCMVTGLTLDDADAHVTISTLSDSFVMQSGSGGNWGQVRKDIELRKGTQCTLRGPSGELLNCEELLTAACRGEFAESSNLGGA